MEDLWIGSWIAAGIIGVFVWGLIGWAIVRYYRRSDDELPSQVRYNLPIEVLYTIAPVIAVAVLFFFTVEKQNEILEDGRQPRPRRPRHRPAVVVDVQLPRARTQPTARTSASPAPPPSCRSCGWSRIESVTFTLHSPDVIHDFWVPSFYFKHDVIPGRDEQFSMTPTAEGTFAGRCAELCGAQHSRMLFKVKSSTRTRTTSTSRSCTTPARSARRAAARTPSRSPDSSKRTHAGGRGRRIGRAAMTAIDASRTPVIGARPQTKGQIIVRYITTTDHKVIGNLYLITSFAFFILGGLMAMIIRAELAQPGQQIVDDEVYNQLFTMHGTIMLLLFATPLFVGFANCIMPLQIGAPDVAFPRLNMFSYWLFLFGGLITVSGFLVPGGAASFGWFAYSPLSNAIRSPGVGGDLWVMGLWMAGLGTILGAVNFVTTIFCMRAPGMTMFRMPIFTWNILVTSLLVLIAFPILAGALLALEADRLLGAHIFDAANGGPILWQHLFWFFGHPEVYIIALPFFGIITEILPGLLPQADLRLHRSGRRHARHRRPVGRGLGAPHVRHRRGRPAVLLVHDVPDRGADGCEVLQLDRHDVGGISVLRHPDALVGRLPDDVPLRRPDRRHPGVAAAGLRAVRLLLRGGALPLRGVRHGRVRDVRGLLLLVAEDHRPDARRAAGQDPLLDPVHRLPRHLPRPALARCRGLPASVRRLQADATASPPSTSSPASSPSCSALSTLPFLYNVWKSRQKPLVGLDDPWGWGRSLEWATSSPPPRHNFVELPRIRSESPAFDLHHPEVALMELEENERAQRRRAVADAPEVDGSPRAPRGADRRRAAARRRRRRGGHAMKIEAWVFGINGIFFLLVTPSYWLFTEDPTGTSALVMTTLLAALVTFYLAFHANQMDPRPEDLKEAEVVDGAGELGFFPPYSWSPLWCALALASACSASCSAGGCSSSASAPARSR